MSAINHVELWVPDLARARPRWGWVLERLGWQPFQDWSDGCSWKAPDGAYIVMEQSPDMTADLHDRMRPGMNHLAVNADNRSAVDAIVGDSELHGWQQLFAHLYPHAGGPDQYAAYLVDEDGFELEIVAVN